MQYTFTQDAVLPIRVNQVGFLPHAPKRCVVIGGHPGDTFQVERMQDCLLVPVFAGTLSACETEDLEPGALYGDFSALAEEGIYRICWNGTNSRCFTICKDAYRSVVRMLCLYFQWQRCGADGWNGPCHTDERIILKDGTERKLVGGHHQSGDLRKWSWGTTEGILELAHFYPTLYEEIKPYALPDLITAGKYYLSLISDEGYVFDCTFVPEEYDEAKCLNKGMQDYNAMWKKRRYFDSPAMTRSQWNVMRALSEISIALKDAGLSELSVQCMNGAHRICHWMLGKGRTAEYKDWPLYPPLGHSDYKDVYFIYWFPESVFMQSLKVCALSSLYLAAPNDILQHESEESLRSILKMAIRNKSGHIVTFRTGEVRMSDVIGEHPSDVIQLCFAIALETWPDSTDAPVWKQTLRDLADRLCFISSRNAYGKSTSTFCHADSSDNFDGLLPDSQIGYRHFNYCYNKDLSLSAVFLISCAQLLNEPSYIKYAQRFIDWQLGLNPYDASNVEGVGYHVPHRGIYGEFAPPVPQIPGAVGVGIMPGDFSCKTFGYSNEYDMPMVGALLHALCVLKNAIDPN